MLKINLIVIIICTSSGLFPVLFNKVTFKKMIKKIAKTTFIVIKPYSRLSSFSVTFDGTNRLKVFLKFGYFSVKWKSFHKNLYCGTRGPSIYYVSKFSGFLAPSLSYI